ncbi:MAG: hypothetical protein A2511_06165 [Deltaproteobacteria bacterium RIFOXYD12_FULL_50_9]|nr:MAG: hypothetical protein A2511_06165 [Deltaproteobacteria bacterium RIFOXYD12_FULL_50_9]
MNRARRAAGAAVMMIICLLWAGGCSSRRPQTVSVMSPDFFGISEEIAVQLSHNDRQSAGSGQRLILTTMVNIDDFSKTSRFGRTLTEALATRLFQHGYGVAEIRKAAEVMIKDNSGELMLTRDLAMLSNQHSVEAVVVGTYSLTPNSVILNVKLLDATSEDVISVAGLEIKRSNAINDLLNSTGGLADGELSAYER